MATSPPDAIDSTNSVIDSLRECGRLFFSRGWSVGTSSNYSAVASRDPLQLWVTVSGKDKGRLEQDDFVLVDATGNPVEGQTGRASAETLLHVVAAQLPGVGAVLHTHSVWATILSDLFHAQGGIEITGYEMLKGLDDVRTHEHVEWIDILENTQDIPALAQAVSERMQAGDRPRMHGYLIRRHGLYTWGATVSDARRQVEVFEFLLECVGRRMMFDSANLLAR